MRLQHVVDPGDDCNDGGGRGGESEAGETLNEAGDEGGGEMRRCHEGGQEAEEAGAVL